MQGGRPAGVAGGYVEETADEQTSLARKYIVASFGLAADAYLIERELPLENVPIHRHIALIQRPAQVRLHPQLGTLPGDDKERHRCFIVAENRHPPDHLGIRVTGAIGSIWYIRSICSIGSL